MAHPMDTPRDRLTAEAVRRCLDPNTKNLTEAIAPLIEEAMSQNFWILHNIKLPPKQMPCLCCRGGCKIINGIPVKT